MLYRYCMDSVWIVYEKMDFSYKLALKLSYGFYIRKELDMSEYIESIEKYLAKLREMENKEKAHEKRKEIAETYKSDSKTLWNLTNCSWTVY